MKTSRPQINLALSNDCLAEIFSHLTDVKDIASCVLVCKQWLSVESLLERDLRKIRVKKKRPNLLGEIFSPRKGERAEYICSDSGSSSNSDGRTNHHDSYFSPSTTRVRDVIDSVLSKLVKKGRFLRPNGNVEDLISQIKIGTRAIEKQRKRLPARRSQNAYGLCDRSVSGSRATDVAIQAIAVGLNVTLQALYISDSRKVSSYGLQAIAVKCADLKHLRISRCPRISDYGLEAIANGCPYLQALTINSSSEITDYGVSAIALGCTGLTTLELIGCTEITDQSLQSIAIGCLRLTSLTISDCPLIGSDGIAGTYQLKFFFAWNIPDFFPDL